MLSYRFFPVGLDNSAFVKLTDTPQTAEPDTFVDRVEVIPGVQIIFTETEPSSTTIRFRALDTNGLYVAGATLALVEVLPFNGVVAVDALESMTNAEGIVSVNFSAVGVGDVLARVQIGLTAWSPQFKILVRESDIFDEPLASAPPRLPLWLEKTRL